MQIFIIAIMHSDYIICIIPKWIVLWQKTRNFIKNEVGRWPPHSGCVLAVVPPFYNGGTTGITRGTTANVVPCWKPTFNVFYALSIACSWQFQGFPFCSPSRHNTFHFPKHSNSTQSSSFHIKSFYAFLWYIIFMLVSLHAKCGSQLSTQVIKEKNQKI